MVSIPCGTIKSSEPSPNSLFLAVSIPCGTIKRDNTSTIQKTCC